MADWAQGMDLITTLRTHAAAQPERTAYLFLGDGEHETARLRYGELDRRARALAAVLQRDHARGSRALLLYPPGLAYIEAFWACLYAGLIAVPAYPPARHHVERLRAIVQDATPAVVLTNAALQTQLSERATGQWQQPQLRWLATDTLPLPEADAWQEWPRQPQHLAFLQYTSGSTGTPKGVMVSHHNLRSNQEAIRLAFGHDATSTVVGWLPFYHDMGLIGNILQPLYVGATAVLLPPLAFLERPQRWLQAISRYQAHTSGGPNFAYELCVRTIPEAVLASLDLRHWQIAFNGAEPVQAETLERFAQRFRPAGFRATAFFPCYGLAEATLLVTAPQRGAGPLVQAFDPQGLAAGQVVAAPSAGQLLVGCGQPWGGQEVAIVDQESQIPCAPERLGEVWVRGPGVAAGYWQPPQASLATFAATTTQPGPWLRSGDLGFIKDGQLFLAGRLKDVLIVRGRNYYPHDLEAAAAAVVAGRRPGACAAFAVERNGETTLVLAAEVRRSQLRRQGAAAIFTALRTAVATLSDAPISEWLLVLPGALPKTSSGKLQRTHCRALYLDGALPILARQADDSLGPDIGEAVPADADPLLHTLRLEIAHALGVPVEQIDPQQALSGFALDSLRVVELKHTLERRHGHALPLNDFLTAPSLQHLASRLHQVTPVPARRHEDTMALSFPQQAMWTVHQLDPHSIVYNLHMAVHLQGALDAAALQAACQQLVLQHPALRTSYQPVGDTVRRVQRPATAWPDLCTAVAAETYDADTLQADMSAQVRLPINLQHGPLLRVRLYRHTAASHTLLCIAHHIAVDLWSLLILLRDLEAHYRRGRAALPSEAAPIDYAGDPARDALHPAAWQADWAYWQEQLAGSLPVLSLPLDFPRPATPTYQGAALTVSITPELTTQLHTLARTAGVTPFTVLLATYAVLLARYTQQNDLIIGIPTSGRLDNSLAEAVGNFVNPLPLRCQMVSHCRFIDFLHAVGQQLHNVLVHQAMPMPVLLERLQPERHADHWPLYQTMCVWQQAPSGFAAPQLRLALGTDGPGWAFANVQATPMALRERLEMFDLKLMGAELPEGWELSLQYRRDLFAADTIQRMADHLTLLLAAIAVRPETPLHALPRFRPETRQQVVYGWNATATTWPDAALLPELLARQTQHTPQSPAVIAGEHTLSYAQLDCLANRIANGLRQRGVGSDEVVAICAQRSPELVAGLLGILRAGAAYLPLAPDDPPLRLHTMLHNVHYALVQPQWQERLAGFAGHCLPLDLAGSAFQDTATTPPVLAWHPDQLAYVLFTSGSTGTPKGVGISHAGLRNRLLWMQDVLQLQPGEAVLQKTPYTFDVSVWEFFWPLLVGGCVVLAGPQEHRDATRLAELIAAHQVTTVHFVPSMLAAFLDSVDVRCCHSLRRIICSGEALSETLSQRCQSLLPARLYNFYGPTEASIDVSAWACDRDTGGPVPIGHPVANTTIYLLDADLEPVPIGVPGDIYLGGVQLARGYLDRPGLTAAAFVPDPCGPAGGRLYRTGDRGRYRPDGAIEYLGRQDQQVKLRGLRIELGEIEAQLRQVVREAVVVVWGEPARLVAYVVPQRPPDAPLEEELRQHLMARLPDYMVPAIFVCLEALPLSPHGKLERQRLPAPVLQSAMTHEPPRTWRETTLAQIWAEVLHLPQVGIQDNFFHLGGDSIRAIQIASRARQQGLELSPRQVLQYPTIATLAAVVQDAVETTAAQETPVAPFALVDLLPEQQALASTPDLEDLYPLTPMQEGILFHSLMYPGSGIYVMQDHYRIHGALDVAAFRNAWESVIARHPILRTSFLWEGIKRPHQRVHRQVTLPFTCDDWRGLSTTEQTRRLDAFLATERANGLDLHSAPLFRLHLFRLDDHTWHCVRTYHHVLLDEWCTSPLFLELRQRYAAQVQGTALDLARVRPFCDYLAWLHNQDTERSRQFWQHYLDDFQEPTPLVVDQVLSEERGVADALSLLPPQDTAALHTLARCWQLTPNTLIQAAWALLLSHYSGRQEVLFGVTVAGRPAELPGIESTLGLFINTLPLRVHIRPEVPLEEWLHELMARNLELRQYEHTPLVQVQEYSAIPRGQELFQHLLVYENVPLDPILLADRSILDMRFVGSRVHTNYPLTMTVIPGAELLLKLTYQTERFARPVIEALLRHFRQLLLAMIQQPAALVGELAMLEAAERHQVLYAWNQTAHPYPEPAEFVAAFAQQVAAHPEAIAARCGEASLSYRQLYEAAQRLASGLRAQGVGTDTLVALLDERGLDLLVMIVGVLQAGAAYLPLDPRHPPARWTAILTTGRVPLALCGDTWQEALHSALGEPVTEVTRVLSYSALLASASASPTAPTIVPQQLAYVIYTSGSTGTPKGAMVDRRGMYNNLMTKVPTLGLGAGDVIAQTAPQSFDISVWQFLTALLCGATVDILPDAVTHNPAALLQALQQRGITVLESVPAVIRSVLDDPQAPAELPALRWLIPTGEAVPPALCQRWLTRYPHVALLNAYGPAECADDVAYHRIDGTLVSHVERVPIGRPVANLQMYVLGPHGDPLPAGIPGEICLAGVGVGRGYRNGPALTAAAFLPNPYGPPGSRLYCTGDLGYWRADGVLEYLGRVDHQVKIRGHRVELGEIEAVLCRHPQVSAAAVQTWPDVRGDLFLAAYIVPTDAGDLDTATLHDFLAARLPSSMLPTCYEVLAALPLNANGKLDRRALPQPQPVASGPDTALTPTEEVLAGIWSTVLGCGAIRREAHFFELGGHSLLATQVMARLYAILALDVPFRSLFDFPRLGQFAARIEQLQAISRQIPVSEPPRPRQPADDVLPLSYAQERLWVMLQLDPDHRFYHFATAVQVTGALDIAACEAALRHIVARHEVLRSVFIEEGGDLRQRVLPELPLYVTWEDLSAFPEGQRQQILQNRLQQVQQQPFDLVHGPLLRVGVWQLATGTMPQQVVLFCFHHIVFDGWSFGVFLREFMTLYPALQAGQSFALPPLPLQYGDYVLWQRQQLRGERLTSLLQYWTEQLRDAPPCLDLPLDRPRMDAPSAAADAHAFALGELSSTLYRFSQEQGVTLFMTMLAALNVLLHALSGVTDMVIGADIANRPQHAFEPLIGFFLNLLALRTRLQGNPRFVDILAQVRQVTLDAYSHQALPFDRLVDALRPTRTTAYAPLFQVKIVCHNVPLDEVSLPGLQVEPLPLPTERSELDLVLHMYPSAQHIRCLLEYRIALFDATTIARLAELYGALLTQVSVAPERRLQELAVSLREHHDRLRRRDHSAQQARQLARLGSIQRRRIPRP